MVRETASRLFQMNNIFLLLLFVAIFAAVWIEVIPERYGVIAKLLMTLVVISIGIGWLPSWPGWVILSIGIAQLAWIYFSPKRRREWPNLFSAPVKVLRDSFSVFKSEVISGGSQKRDRKPAIPADSPREKTRFLTIDKLRKSAGAVFVVVLSPLAAIPSALVLSALLFTWYVLFGNDPQAAVDLHGELKQALAIGFMAIIATADLFFRHWWFSGPLLLAGGYAITAYSIGSGIFWRRYFRGLLLFGTIYPIVYVVADIFDWFDRPFFN